MGAIPVISAAVSAVGTLSNINNANKQANAQAAAISNEKTAAIINAEITQANIAQQDKIAKTQNDIAVIKIDYDAQMASKNAQLQRDSFALQQEANKVAIEQQRVALVNQQLMAKEQLELQRINAVNETRKADVQTQAQLSEAQASLGQPTEQSQQLARLVNNTRALNAMGTGGNSAIRDYLEQENQAIRASMQELANEGDRVTRETDESVNLLNEAANADAAAVDAQVATSNRSIDESEAQVNNQNVLADQILADYNASIEVLRKSQLTDTEFADAMREQQVIAQQRAAREGLSSNMTALDAQASGITRPGLADLVGGAFNVYNTYTSLNSQQQALNARRNAPESTFNQRDYRNPRFDVNAGMPTQSPTAFDSNTGSFSSGLTYDLVDPLLPISANVTRGMSLEQMSSSRPSQPRVIEFKAPNVKRLK